MLRLEVSVPSINRSYEFVVNEYVKMPILVGELAQVISAKEGKEWDEDPSRLVLCDSTSGMVLPMEKTLYQCKVVSGSKLILV